MEHAAWKKRKLRLETESKELWNSRRSGKIVLKIVGGSAFYEHAPHCYRSRVWELNAS